MGRRPWSRGYSEHRTRCIKENIVQGVFNPKKLGKNYGLRIDERIIEYPWLFSRLPIMKGNLLDAGSVLNYQFLLENETLTSKKIFISTLAPEQSCFWKEAVSYVYEDLRNSCFKNCFFDWVVSLSTIEHIGLDNTMLFTSDKSKNENSPETFLKAVQEYKRILKPGGTLYLSVPFGRKAVYRWFQIFDSKMIDQVIETFEPSILNEYHYKYEVSGWRVSSREESAESTYFDYHTTKSYDADYAAASRAVVCLELTK